MASLFLPGRNGRIVRALLSHRPFCCVPLLRRRGVAKSLCPFSKFERGQETGRTLGLAGGDPSVGNEVHHRAIHAEPMKPKGRLSSIDNFLEPFQVIGTLGTRQVRGYLSSDFVCGLAEGLRKTCIDVLDPAVGVAEGERIGEDRFQRAIPLLQLPHCSFQFVKSLGFPPQLPQGGSVHRYLGTKPVGWFQRRDDRRCRSKVPPSGRSCNERHFRIEWGVLLLDSLKFAGSAARSTAASPGPAQIAESSGPLSYTASAECKQNDSMLIVMHRWPKRKELIFNNRNNYDIIHENMNLITHVMVGRFSIMPTFQKIFRHGMSVGKILPATGSTTVEISGHTTHWIRHHEA